MGNTLVVSYISIIWYLIMLLPYESPNKPSGPLEFPYTTGIVSQNFGQHVPNHHSQSNIYRDWCV